MSPNLNLPWYKGVHEEVLKNVDRIAGLSSKMTLVEKNPIEQRFSEIFNKKLFDNIKPQQISLQSICYKIHLTFQMIINSKFKYKLAYAFGYVNHRITMHKIELTYLTDRQTHLNKEIELKKKKEQKFKANSRRLKQELSD